MAGNDFVQVQLTAFGIKFAANGPLTISNGKRSLIFQPGVPERIEASYEWNAWLAGYRSPTGDILFELAPATKPGPPAAEPAPAIDSVTPQKEND